MTQENYQHSAILDVSIALSRTGTCTVLTVKQTTSTSTSHHQTTVSEHLTTFFFICYSSSTLLHNLLLTLNSTLYHIHWITFVCFAIEICNMPCQLLGSLCWLASDLLPSAHDHATKIMPLGKILLFVGNKQTDIHTSDNRSTLKLVSSQSTKGCRKGYGYARLSWNTLPNLAALNYPQLLPYIYTCTITLSG